MCLILELEFWQCLYWKQASVTLVYVLQIFVFLLWLEHKVHELERFGNTWDFSIFENGTVLDQKGFFISIANNSSSFTF